MQKYHTSHTSRMYIYRYACQYDLEESRTPKSSSNCTRCCDLKQKYWNGINWMVADQLKFYMYTQCMSVVKSWTHK